MIVDRYYYHQLNKQEQAIYKAFYNGAPLVLDMSNIPNPDDFDEGAVW